MKKTPLLLFILPLFAVSGGYYNGIICFLVILIVSSLCFTVFQRKSIVISFSGISVCLTMFTLLAVFSVLLAVNKEYAFYGSMEVLGAYIFYVYLLQRREGKAELNRYITEVIVYLCFGLCLFGISVSLFEEIRDIVLRNGRLAVGIVYANTFATFCFASIILSNKLGKKKKELFFIQLTIWVGAVLTMSRGAILIGSAALIALMIYKPKKRYVNAASMVSGISLGTLISLLPQYTSAVVRVSETNPNATEWLERLFYYKDGIKMIFEHPFGIGSGNNYLLQGRVQSAYYYNIPHIHNGVLQFAIDFGILASLLFLGAFFIFMFSRAEFYDKLTVLMLFLHGLIDFDWKFMCMLCIFYYLYAAASVEKVRYVNINQAKRVFAAIIFAGIILVSFQGMLLSYYIHEKNGEKATAICPYSPSAWIVKAEYSMPEEKISCIETANKLLKNQDERVIKFLVRSYRENNQVDLAFQSALNLIELRDLDITNFELASELGILAAEEKIEAYEYSTAKEILEEVIRLENRLEAARNKVAPEAYKLKHKPNVFMTETLIKNSEKAGKMLEQLR